MVTWLPDSLVSAVQSNKYNVHLKREGKAQCGQRLFLVLGSQPIRHQSFTASEMGCIQGNGLY